MKLHYCLQQIWLIFTAVFISEAVQALLTSKDLHLLVFGLFSVITMLLYYISYTKIRPVLEQLLKSENLENINCTEGPRI